MDEEAGEKRGSRGHGLFYHYSWWETMRLSKQMIIKQTYNHRSNY